MMKRKNVIFTLLLTFTFLLISYSPTSQAKEPTKCLLLRKNSYTFAEKALMNHIKSTKFALYQTYLQNYVIHKTADKEEDANPTETPQIQTEKIYIGNINSRKFHTAECWTLPIEKNRIEFSSREDAINNNYVPCKNCNP